VERVLIVKPIENEEIRGSIPPSASAEVRLSAQELAGALHEVSNALTVVLGWLEVAQQHVVGERAREALDVALRQARLGHRVARRAIGATPSSENGSGILDDTVFDALLAVRPLAERRNIQLRENGLPQPRAYLPTPDVATQVLINLLLNAIAFSPEGGAVTVECRSTAERVVIRVSDQGPGIDATRAATMWEGPVSTRHGGAGIGLSYCRKLALEQGADLRLISHDKGAIFELEWPRAEAAQGEPEALPVARSLDGLRILLVEDDASICSLVELTFECHGSKVVSAGSMSDVKQVKLREARFDLALVDLSPFGPDIEGGLSVLREGAPNMPMILITGSAAGLPEGAEASFSAWVRKPFEAGELVSAVRRIIGR
jgi:CheY-like chemotaxis protein